MEKKAVQRHKLWMICHETLTLTRYLMCGLGLCIETQTTEARKVKFPVYICIPPTERPMALNNCLDIQLF